MSENRKVAVESCTKRIRRHANAHGDNNRKPMFDGEKGSSFSERWVDISQPGGWQGGAFESGRPIGLCLAPAVNTT